MMRPAAGCLAVALLASPTMLAKQAVMFGNVPAGQRLVSAANIVYQGSFRVPKLFPDAVSYRYNQGAMSYNAANNSIFLAGFGTAGLLGELAIPTLHTGVLSGLTTATALQGLADPTAGTLNNINPSDPNAKLLGGTLIYGGSLYITGYSYYDGGGTQVLSHFKSSTTIGSGVTGPFQVGTTFDGKASAGFIAGAMALIPAEWQTALGGPVLSGQCCLGILGRTSSGPAVYSITPSDIGVTIPAPANILLGYPIAHQTIGEQYGGADPAFQFPSASAPTWGFNGSTEVRGIVMPVGWASVLFFGRHPLAGTYCYGAGTATQALHGTLVGPTEPGVIYCYDPLDTNGKGSHGYPYSFQVWAYRAADLARVKAGAVSPWNIRPYATWVMTFPYADGGIPEIVGAAYNPTTGMIYLAQAGADNASGGFGEPLIHGYLVQ